MQERRELGGARGDVGARMQAHVHRAAARKHDDALVGLVRIDEAFQRALRFVLEARVPWVA